MGLLCGKILNTTVCLCDENQAVCECIQRFPSASDVICRFIENATTETQGPAQGNVPKDLSPGRTICSSGSDRLSFRRNVAAMAGPVQWSNTTYLPDFNGNVPLWMSERGGLAQALLGACWESRDSPFLHRLAWNRLSPDASSCICLTTPRENVESSKARFRQRHLAHIWGVSQLNTRRHWP